MKATLLLAATALSLITMPCVSGVDMVPTQPATAPNYFCPWAVQGYMYGIGAPNINVEALESGQYTICMNANTEDHVFGPQGWAKTFFPQVRKDLYFLMDDGYESGGKSSMELDVKKFPSFSGSPPERLKSLSKAVQNEGWRGLALFCRDTPKTIDEITPLLQWSKDAGVLYWKIDGGDEDYSVQHLKQTVYPELVLEHAGAMGPLDGDWQHDGRFAAQHWSPNRKQRLCNSDVDRIYDITPFLSVPTTLDRLAQMLNGVQGHPEATALINCEDEVYMAAAMGCTMGVMRFPLVGLRPNGDPDLFFAGPRQAKRRMDEVVRALHWERIAEPFAAGNGYVILDSNILTDDWVYQPGETWETKAIGKDVKQGAPARISRNLPLPTVVAEGELPFVLAARFPNDAVAVCTLERTLKDNAWFMPPADVTVNVADAKGPFGVFGHYRNLTFQMNEPPHNVHVWAQDLAGTSAEDVTQRIHIDGTTITIPGSLIDKIGTQAATPGDLSDPGIVLKIEKL